MKAYTTLQEKTAPQIIGGKAGSNPLQSKAAAMQLQGGPEEELQMKQNPLQMQAPEEELQMKAAPFQLQEGEEEALQMKVNPLQRQGGAVEELQMKVNPLQKKESNHSSTTGNSTGMPDQLKSGVENLSGIAMDDVKVHYNSDKPAGVGALAYAQGTDIHIGSGQEQHLPHEAWHVAQQKQGRVQPTTQMKGVAVNDDQSLETEADVMGAKAAQLRTDDMANS